MNRKLVTSAAVLAVTGLLVVGINLASQDNSVETTATPVSTTVTSSNAVSTPKPVATATEVKETVKETPVVVATPEVKPEVKETVAVKPVVKETVKTTPVVVKPVVTAPVVTKPVVTKPVVTTPVVTTPKYVETRNSDYEVYKAQIAAQLDAHNTDFRIEYKNKANYLNYANREPEIDDTNKILLELWDREDRDFIVIRLTISIGYIDFLVTYPAK